VNFAPGPAAGLSEAAQATRGSGVRLAAELGSRIFALATSFLLAAGLGVESFGVFAAASGVAVLLAELGELGLQQTAARALVAGTLGLRAMLRARLALTALALLVAAASATASAVLPPLVLFFVLTGWSEFLGVALRARGHRVAEAMVLLSLRASTLAAVAVALAGDVSLTGLAWAHVASSLPPLLLGSVLAARVRGAGPVVAPQAVAFVLKASLPLAVNGALALVALRVELLLVFALRGSYEAGLFGAALKIVEALNGVPTAISAGAMPSLTREALAAPAGTGPAPGPAAVRARTAASAALLGVPAAVGLGLLAPGVVRLLGADYAGAAPALRVLSVAVVAHFMNSVLIHSLIAAGRAGWLPRMSGGRVAAAALAALVLVPRWGAVGAAVGYTASETLLLAAYARACVLTGFRVRLAAPLSAAAAASVPMTLVVGAVAGGTVPRAAAGAAVYAATLAVAWWLGRPRLVRLLGVEETA
jgi:O-antigen/teichoic acid export membrane protein